MKYKLNTWYEFANRYDGEVSYIYIYFIDEDSVKYHCVVFNETNGEPYEFVDVDVIIDEFEEIFNEEEMESIKTVDERYIINTNFC